MRNRIAVVAVVVAVLSASPSSSAQRAEADLVRVAAADLESTDGWGHQRICLNDGAYVLAFQAIDTAEQAGAGLFDEDTFGPAPDLDDEAATAAAYRFMGSIEYIPPNSDRGWGWSVHTVYRGKCYDLGASNSRVRLYQVAVGVDWPR